MVTALVWQHSTLVPAPTPGGPLLAADSWLVSDGRIRGADRHQTRFRKACAEVDAVHPEVVADFWRAALDRLPVTGDWFPRVELSADGRLWLRIRPAPARGGPVSVWVPDVPDPRAVPHRKGPDLDVLAGLRERAMRRGAQDALLRTRAGLVVEAAHACVLWWEGDTLCVPSAELRTFPGVTTTLIQERAAGLGIPIARRRVPLQALAAREVWLTNALHGIRPVQGWIGAGVEPRTATRAPDWQRWLCGQTVSVA